MNGIESVWEQVERFRDEHFTGQLASLPVDVFTVAELDLKLDIIPFDDLSAKYGMDAMLLQDFTGIYVDAEAYQFLENGPVWKQKRLRFTFAHELGHFVLHREVAASRNFSDFRAFFRWLHEESAARYRIEQEANEFAGRLLVPIDRIQDDFDRFAVRAAELSAQWQALPDMRRALAERLSDKYGVNAQVIETRLDREAIWGAQ
jgi:Zn-dependent peptidase ImmA (M78 family)